MNVEPYLFFEGRAEEAAEFYKQTLGAQVLFLMRFSESPDQAPEASEGCASDAIPDHPNKVMHMLLQIGDSKVMGSDGNCGGNSEFKGFGLTLNLPTVEESQRIFGLLGEGGNVQMPMMQTFFSPSFGMVADKFGVTWMVMAQGPEQGQ